MYNPDGESDLDLNRFFNHRHTGELVATHRKVHLFDIDIPGKITFKVYSVPDFNMFEN